METVLINGAWRPARSVGAFQAENPATAETLPEQYPISDWADVDAALEAAGFRVGDHSAQCHRTKIEKSDVYQLWMRDKRVSDGGMSVAVVCGSIPGMAALDLIHQGASSGMICRPLRR